MEQEGLYELHQRTNSKVQRALKSSNYSLAIKILYETICKLITNEQWNSAFECCTKLLSILTSNSSLDVDQATAVLCEIFDQIEKTVSKSSDQLLTWSCCSKFFTATIEWSQQESCFKYGDSELLLRIGNILMSIDENEKAVSFLSDSLHQSTVNQLAVCAQRESTLVIPIVAGLLKNKNFQFATEFLLLVDRENDFKKEINSINKKDELNFAHLLLNICLSLNCKSLAQELQSHSPVICSKYQKELSFITD